MSSQLYPKAREKFLTAQLSWLSGTYRAVLFPETYIPDFSDEFLSDVFGGVRIALSDPITNRTATGGVAGCDPIRFGTLVDARKASSIAIYRDSGNEMTSDLICFIDSPQIQGVPLSLIGLDYFFIPSELGGGLFRI